MISICNKPFVNKCIYAVFVMQWPSKDNVAIITLYFFDTDGCTDRFFNYYIKK